MYIYVSGPYTQGDALQNVHKAIDAAEQLIGLGYTPFVPHLSHFWHMIHPHPWEFWIEQDLAWIARCDGLLRLPGPSKGADIEVARAIELGLPVWMDIALIGRPAVPLEATL